MFTKFFKELIDYYISKQNNLPSFMVSLLALIISIIAIFVSYYTFRKQRDRSITEYLSNIWNDVIDKCLDNPQFIDINKTEHYYQIMDNDENLKYEAYCYKIWGHIEDIVNYKKHNNKQFIPIIQWVTCYHYTWLSRNPTFFCDEKFWEIVEETRKKPQMVFGYKKLPSKDGNINWDIICEDYYSYILSPFAPEMVKPDANGKIRNLLLEYLLSIPVNDLAQMNILDFGCGPGNLIPYFSRKINLVGVDTSEESLEKAKTVASNYKNINFKGIYSNIMDLNTQNKYDLIISSNSILPKTRDEVCQIYNKLRELLTPTGKIVAILPSFDTTIYLKNLWEKYYLKLNVSNQQIQRISKSLVETKKMNYEALSYADDGHNIQCYHTKESIINETKKCGLQLVAEPKKVYYPWDLTRRFDYGYFPSPENEEIWDWFIIAERQA